MALDNRRLTWLEASPRTIRLDLDASTLDVVEIGRALGYKPHGCCPTPAYLEGIVHAMKAEACRLIDPLATFAATTGTFDDASDTVACGPPRYGSLLIGRIVCGQIRRARAVAAFVVTIGDRLEQAARNMMHHQQALDGFVLDTIGSVAVEAAADLFQTELTRLVAPLDWRVTNRYSPGYCTWPTADQHALFALLPRRPAGVTLSRSSLMTPIKSISGIIGLGEAVEHRPYICDVCGVPDCTQRLVDARH